jgi:hypothetical protein
VLSWWPKTDDYETLYTASLFMVWLFIWDDQVDMNDNSLSHDFEQACFLRSQTLLSVENSLGLRSGQDPFMDVLGPMTVFREFGTRAADRLNNSTCQV